MPIITLTSDLGSRDYYAAALKGTLVSLCPEATLIDISHEVPMFDVREGAFILKNAYRYFPEGTIHLFGIDNEGGRRKNAVIMELNGHIFVGPDNAFASLIREGHKYESVVVSNDSTHQAGNGYTFLVRNFYGPLAARIASGEDWRSMGEPSEVREYHWGEPSYYDNSLRGIIQYIDAFGNAITNIHKDHFLAVKGDRSFIIYLRKLKLQRIVSAYCDVPRGDAAAIFTESGFLEISLRDTSAGQLLGLSVMDSISIEFHE